MALLTTRQLVKSYGGIPVLKGIDFTLEEGKVVSIMGPSGSGKSTLLRCLNVLEYADSGDIWFDGQLMGVRRTQDAVPLSRARRVRFQKQGVAFGTCSNLPVMPALP